jgi:hypothetical protein
MRPINITITETTAEAILWALREFRNTRTPVREYVDKRYAHMDESFRNCKIGDVQTRLDRLQSFIDRTQTQLTMEREYEKAK